MIARLVTLLAQIEVDPSDIDVLPQGGLVDTSITDILNLVFGAAGGVALIIITIAGFKYVLSQGNPQETAKAKNTILYALIGLVICIMAVAIVNFVIAETA